MELYSWKVVLVLTSAIFVLMVLGIGSKRKWYRQFLELLKGWSLVGTIC